jgi:thymidylate synthase
MQNYLDYLKDILDNGTRSADRTGTGTRKVFGRQLRWDLSEGFPAVTTRRLWLRGVFEELMWFLNGETNIVPLVEKGVSIWTDWPYQDYIDATGDDITMEEFEEMLLEKHFHTFGAFWGELGPVYGAQWRGTNDGVDQIDRALKLLRERPDSRRIIVDSWNADDLGEMRLPPCHYSFQLQTETMTLNQRYDALCRRGFEQEDVIESPRAMMDELDIPTRRLNLMWNQRSVDSGPGLTFNIASYALLTHMIAQQTGLEPGTLIFSGGDCHIYENHIDQIREQIQREPFERPTLKLQKASDLYSYTWDDVELADYQHHEQLHFPIAV